VSIPTRLIWSLIRELVSGVDIVNEPLKETDWIMKKIDKVSLEEK